MNSDFIDWATDYFADWNKFAWVLSNMVIFYVAIMLLLFVLGYVILFNPKATTAGRYIFRFFVSLIAVIGLVFISLFVDPAIGHKWYEFPGDVIFWRPTVRLAGYLYVAFSITSLAGLLVVRKFHPHLIVTALDKEIIQTRKELNES